MSMTYAQHAEHARGIARVHGFADCIHYAPDWQARVDRLYAIQAGDGRWGGQPFLLSDGRMVLASGDFVYVEIKGEIKP